MKGNICDGVCKETDMKRKSCVKSLRSLFNRKHILSHLLLFYSVSLLKENPKRLMKRYLSTAIERKSCLTEVFLPMCDLSLIGKHIVAYAPLLLCFFIEGKSYVWLFWCMKEKNFFNHFDQTDRRLWSFYCISLLKEILLKSLPLSFKCEKSR